MKKSRFTEEQIAFALKQAETGTPVAEVLRRMGISEQTFYRWKKLYGGLGTGELRRLKQLEDENRKLKQLVADLSLRRPPAAGPDGRRRFHARGFGDRGRPGDQRGAGRGCRRPSGSAARSTACDSGR